MPKPTKGNRLGGSPAHQRIILANLASQLFEHGRIKTTAARAEALQPFAERLITKAKEGSLHSRRQVAKIIRDKGILAALFDDIAPIFAEREGGYTRILNIGPRKGDNAPMAYIELITDKVVKKQKPAPKAEDAKDKPADTTDADEVEETDEATVDADAEATEVEAEADVADAEPADEAAEAEAAEEADDAEPAADADADAESDAGDDK